MRGSQADAEADREAQLARDLLQGRPPVLAGALIASIACLLAALFGWLAWAQVDEVVHAAGAVEPAGRVKIVNHPRGGRVAAIHVREGEAVEAGVLLVSFDGDVARSERSELLGRLQLRTAEAARLAAEAESRALVTTGARAPT